MDSEFRVGVSLGIWAGTMNSEFRVGVKEVQLKAYE